MQGNKLIIGVVAIFILVVLGFSVYYFTQGGNTSAAGTLGVSGPNATDTPATIAGRDFLVVLNQIQNITLSTSTLNDRVFMSLIDQSVTLQEQPMGRSNPFAVLGAEGSTTPNKGAVQGR